MGESEGYSSPEYSDDEIKKKPKEKKVVKEVIKEEEIKLPSQMGYKPKKESKIPPPPDRLIGSADPLNKKKIFLPKPRHIKRNEKYSGNRTRNENDVGESRNERYSRNENIDAGETKNGKPSATGATGEKAKNKPMVSSNFRPAREGSEVIKDEVKMYYRASQSAVPIEPCVNPNENETYENFVKSPSIPESRQILDSKLVKNLKFNDISKLRPVQIAMLTAALTYPRGHPETSNADILCTSKTGSGKTLAFIVPILQKAIERQDLQPNKDARTPMALIFVNSTELAMSVFHVVKTLLHGLHLRVVVMAASLNFVENTNFDIGICTNGRFQNHFSHTMTLGNSAVQLDLSQLEYIVIDEVDKMASDIKFLDILDKLKTEAKKPRIFGLSATIDADTTQIIRYSSVFLIKCGEHNVIPPNITQLYWQVTQQSATRLFRNGRGKAAFRGPEIHPKHPFDTLYKALTQSEFLKGKRFMVFVKRTRIADFIALRLREYGVPAVSIHKKLKDVQTPIDMYNKGKVNIAIVTQYFTRGIDTEVDVVINYDLPIIATDFIHRCGRTGRNGNTGIAITFIDLLDQENYNPEVVQQIVETLAENENAVIPDFLEQRVADHKNWSLKPTI